MKYDAATLEPRGVGVLVLGTFDMARILLLAGVFVASAAVGEGGAEKCSRLTMQDLERLRKMVDLKIENRYEKPLRIGQLIDSLNEQLGKKVVVFDAAALGKKAKRVANAEVKVPPFPKQFTIWTLLRLAASQLADPGLASFRVEPDRIRITRFDEPYQFHEVDHDVADLMKKHISVPFRDFASPALAAKRVDPRAALLEAVAGGRHFSFQDKQRGEMAFVNGTTLRVRTSIENHWGIIESLASLRRLADLAVRFDTRVLEVDAAEYDKRLAPMFADQRMVTAVEPALAEELQKRSVLVSNRVMLLPGVKGEVLALKHVFSYVSDTRTNEGTYKTAAYGFSFAVQSVVSSDRRHVRLTLWQNSVHLARIDKSKPPKEVGLPAPDLESPVLREHTEKATIAVADLQPLLVRVNWQGKDKSKRLVMLATPTIWIEEEQALIKASVLPAMPTLVPAQKGVRPVSTLEKTKQVEQILQSLVADVAGPNCQSARGFYGSPGEKRLALYSVEKDGIAWPTWFNPKVAGFRISHVFAVDREKPFAKRLCGIRLDKLDLKTKELEVTLMNVGGTENGGVIGACFVRYRIVEDGGMWGVRFESAFDP